MDGMFALSSYKMDFYGVMADRLRDSAVFLMFRDESFKLDYVICLMKARKCLLKRWKCRIGIEKCWKKVKVLVEIKKVPDESSKVPVKEMEVPDRNRKVLEESESAG